MTITSWDQCYPYNKYCPIDTVNQYRCVVGPVATAMAQVIKYWERPIHPHGTHNYTFEMNDCEIWQRVSLGIIFDTVSYNYSNMPSTLDNVSDTTQINEVARLMYHCGIASNTMFGISTCGGSGTYMSDAATALVSYYDFVPTLNLIYKSNYVDSVWQNMIINELAHGRPVIYAGSDNNGGHAFVCDGYCNGRFHFNFGWGGFGDGYYPLDSINLSAYYSFNYGQHAIIGIMPANTVFDTTILHDTVYVTYHFVDTVFHSDTIYLPQYIHDTINSIDTVYQRDTIYLPVYIHDTTNIVENTRDTIYLPQYIHDTLYIRDTIYITQEGINGADALNAKIYQQNGQVVVEGAEDKMVTLYDVNGRVLATKQDYDMPLRFEVPATGTYMIKIGRAPARRVVVIR